jgi:tungsten cofactor oxidoreducase radical SAM maturase
MRIKIERDGWLRLPERYIKRYRLNKGAEVYLIPTEEGFILRHPTSDIKKVYIEPTSRCNLNCITCIRNSWGDEKADMEMSTFEAIMKQLKGLKHLREVALGGFGEPFYHPYILRMIEDIKTLGVKLTISTNGTLLDELADPLVELGMDNIIVSIDSVYPQTFSDIRRGASLNEVLENVRRLNGAKRRKRRFTPSVGIEFVLMRRNVDEIPRLPELAHSVGASSVLITNLLPRTEEMCDEVLYDGRLELPKSIGWPISNRTWLEWGTMRLPKMQWGARRNCRFVEGKSLVIGHDGGVSPCYALMHSYTYYIFGRRKEVKRYILGNVLENPISSIWMSEEYVRFRNRVRMFDFPSCVDCGLACDLAERNEDCWANNPSCADCLWASDIIRCP